MPGLGGVPHDLTLDDAIAVLRSVREVDKLAPMVVGTETVAFGERRRQVALIGGTHEALEVRRLAHRARALPAGDPLGPERPGRGARHAARAGAVPAARTRSARWCASATGACA